MASLHSCPPEIHAYIAHFACLLDPGYTIRSLALVSRYFHHISLPYLYHTISVAGTRNILSLHNALRKADAQHSDIAPKVATNIRHLFVSTERSNGLAPPNIQLINAVQAILASAAPTIQSLTLDLSLSPRESAVILSLLFRTRFPALRDLSVSGLYPNPNTARPRCPDGTASPESSNFPLLERLYLDGNRSPHGLFTIGSLASTFPALTHLHVSGLRMAVAFAKEVESVLHPTPDTFTRTSVPPSSPPEPTDGGAVAPNLKTTALYPRGPVLPPRLSRLTLQAGEILESVTSPPSPGSNAASKHALMLDRLQRLSKGNVDDQGNGGDRELRGEGEENLVEFELRQVEGASGGDDLARMWRARLYVD